jgi:hypothetical protein
MTNQEWIEMLRLIPEEEQNQSVLVLLNGSEISVDTFYRFEPTFLVFRGRVAGTTDEGRAFFVPYDQMLYYRIERVVNIAELRDIVSKGRPVDDPPTPTSAPAAEVPASVPVAPPTADPTATRNALLNRIRAARASQVPSPRHNTQD